MSEAKEKKEAHVAALRQKAYKLGLYGASVLSVPLDDLAKHYNGCGPEWLPSAAREKLTAYLAIFEPAFMIHDWRFSRSDGTRCSFDFANFELEHNLRRIAKAKYGFLNWRRYRALAAAELIAEACSRYGWSAYCDGMVKGIAAEEESKSKVEVEQRTVKNSIVGLGLITSTLLLLLTGCYRSITVSRYDEYELVYRSVGLKTDVSKIEAEKMTNGTVRVLVEGVATDVSERNAKIVESSGTALGNVAEKVIEGMK